MVIKIQVGKLMFKPKFLYLTDGSFNFLSDGDLIFLKWLLNRAHLDPAAFGSKVNKIKLFYL